MPCRRLRPVTVLLALGAAGCNDTPKPRASVVLVTVDTLRADHLGCYGYVRDTSPFLDSLAERGVRFENAWASCSHTAPAHASILTGLHPVQHRVLRNGHELPPDVPSVAEVFAAAGYETVGVTSAAFLRSLDPGFETFSAYSGAWTGANAKETVDRTLRILEDRDPKRPLFLWVHLYDPHWPYLSNDTDYHRELAAATEEQRRDFLRYLQQEHGIPTSLAPEHVLALHDAYDAEIRTTDREIERLYQSLERQPWHSGAWWCVASDHGEGLGNHSYRDHDKHLYREQTRIVLIVHRADRQLEPRVVDSMARQVDLFPTLLDCAGLAPADLPVEGTSLLPLVLGSEAVAVDFSFAQRRPVTPRDLEQPALGDDPGGWIDEEVIALQDRRFKYIHHSKSEDEFYDLLEDPLEQRNLIGRRSRVQDRLRRLLLERWQRWTLEARGLEPRTDESVDLRELEALGY